MKVDFVSDIHQDFWMKEKNQQSPKFQKQLEHLVYEVLMPADLGKGFTPGEVLIIAGDLGHYNQQTTFLFIELKKIYKEIIITFGNHDMYLVNNSQISKYDSNSQNRVDELKEICENLGIHFLDGKVVTINGVKFGGTGSWYNLPTTQDIESWKKTMNDSRIIYSGYTPKSFGHYYNSSYGQSTGSNWKTQEFWLKEKAKLIDVASNKCDVFITHIGLNEPTKEEGMHEDYIGDPNNIFYYTDNIELLMSSGCKLHIHGHTHQNLDYTKEGINILCNPLGYPSDGTYNTIKQIEI